jgi:hypothetical protein
MQINIPRIIAETAIESYVISLILFILFTFFFKISSLRKAIFLNSINMLGLLSSIVAFGDEIYFLLKTPKRNSELIIYDSYQKDWMLFIPMISFLLVIILFFPKKRRQNMGWSLVGLSLLVWIRLSNGLQRWLMYQEHSHKPAKFSVHFFSFTKDALWLCTVFVLGVFCIAWMHHKMVFSNRSPKMEV